MDGADPECFENPYCVVVTTSTPDPGLHVEKAACGGATMSGPFDVIRGQVSQLQFSGSSVDLGDVACAEGGLDWDRMTDVPADPNPECNDTVLYFLARDSGAGDFGLADPGSEPRDVMNPDPAYHKPRSPGQSPQQRPRRRPHLQTRSGLVTLVIRGIVRRQDAKAQRMAGSPAT